MIVQTTTQQFYRVDDEAGLEGSWIGIAVKRIKDRMGDYYEPQEAQPREILVRKQGTRIIEPF